MNVVNTMVAFSWIIPDRLAGAGRPGLVRAAARDMRALRKQGFGLVVSLTREPLDVSPEDFDMRGIHFPIHNMGVPDLEDVDVVCHQILATLERGEAVLVHCRSGLGRTGTMLACTLVAMGRDPIDTLLGLRTIQRDYVQTRVQEQLIREYAELIRERAHAQGALRPFAGHRVGRGESSQLAGLG